MPTSIISIGRSGAAAARAAIELTAQNIANSANPDYVRRTLQQSELVGTARIDFVQSSNLAGVRVTGVQRANSELVQRQARSAGSDLARADAEIAALRDAETALEQSRLFEGLVGFEASLTLLESDPGDPALRTGAIEAARQLAETFQFADFALSNSRNLLQADIDSGMQQLAGSQRELARINLELVSAREGTAGRAALLDARDAALRGIAEQVGITTRFDQFGAVEVRVDGPVPAVLVQGSQFESVTSQTDAAGTVTFTIGALAFEPASGAMAGRASAMAEIGRRQSELSDIALSTITRANAAQSAGAALDGTPGQPLFSGSDASTITLALQDGAGLAIAPAGSPPGSRDTANLGALIAAFGADDGPIAATDRALLSLSSRIAGLEVLQGGLAVIKSSADAELLSETGVDLDTEAANLIRLQQAFEANSRVIQIASDVFDTILGLR